MNAIQRRYPQVYRGNDRLLLKSETSALDFEISRFLFIVIIPQFGLAEILNFCFFAELVPSPSPSFFSAATPLPIQFVLLLEDTL